MKNLKKVLRNIVPSNTYIATLFAISYIGAKPIPIEPDIHTYNLDPAQAHGAKYKGKTVGSLGNIAAYYLEALDSTQYTLPLVPEWANPVWHLFVIRSQKRDEIQSCLHSKQIETRIHYPIPPHKQIDYKELNLTCFPISEKIHKEVLSLPIGPHLNNSDQKKIITALNIFEQYFSKITNITPT